MKAREIFKILEKSELITSIIIVIILVSLVSLQIFCRYLLNNPLSWTEEVTSYFFIFLAFLAASLVYKRKAHFSVGTFVDLLPFKFKKITRLIILISIGIFLLVLLYTSVKLIFLYSGTYSVIVKIPEEVIPIVMLYSFFSMLLSTFVFILEELKRES